MWPGVNLSYLASDKPKVFKNISELTLHRIPGNIFDNIADNTEFTKPCINWVSELQRESHI